MCIASMKPENIIIANKNVHKNTVRITDLFFSPIILPDGSLILIAVCNCLIDLYIAYIEPTNIAAHTTIFKIEILMVVIFIPLTP